MKSFLIFLIGIVIPLFVYAEIDIDLNCSDVVHTPLTEVENMTAEQYYNLGLRYLCDRQAKEQEGLNLIQKFTELINEGIAFFIGKEVDLEGIQYIRKAAHLGYIPANYWMGVYYLTNKTLDTSQNILYNSLQESIYFVNFNEAIVYYENTAQLIQFTLKNPSIMDEKIPQSDMSVSAFVNLPMLYFVRYTYLFMDSMIDASVAQQQEISTVLSAINKAAKSCVDQLTFYERTDFFPSANYVSYQTLKSSCRSMGDLISDKIYIVEYARERRVETMQCKNFQSKSSCFEHYKYSDMTNDIHKILKDFMEQDKHVRFIF